MSMYRAIETIPQRAAWVVWDHALAARCDHEIDCLACLTGRECAKGQGYADAEQAAHSAYRAACEPLEMVA